MKTFSSLLVSIVIAVWVVAIAIVSVQNAQPISLRFLSFQSIQVPFGLVLAFSAGAGIIAMALLQPLWGIAGSSGRNSSEDDVDFFADDDF
jgi:uncharacterized integral membrane protein